jgi:hypothetical protein
VYFLTLPFFCQSPSLRISCEMPPCMKYPIHAHSRSFAVLLLLFFVTIFARHHRFYAGGAQVLWPACNATFLLVTNGLAPAGRCLTSQNEQNTPHLLFKFSQTSGHNLKINSHLQKILHHNPLLLRHLQQSEKNSLANRPPLLLF